jgi:hypothetical protein
MDLFTSLSAFTVFLGIGVAGFMFLTISALFGELFEHFDGLDDHGGPGLFSSKVVAVFITAFGGSGAVAYAYLPEGPACHLGSFIIRSASCTAS